MYYVERSYRTPDFGMWERGTKGNDGTPEIHASSIGNGDNTFSMGFVDFFLYYKKKYVFVLIQAWQNQLLKQ